MNTFSLPQGFLMGSATASTQIEGNDPNTNWYQWYKDGKIENNDNPFTASGHYDRVQEDTALMKQLNHDTYRLSIEWSRLEPKEGEWSQEGLDYYINEIKMLLDAGIKPLVTLHHFSHPQWFEELGQWTNPKAPEYFINYVTKLLNGIDGEGMADLVADYCTINEPNVMAMSSFIEGIFPPGKTDDLGGYFKCTQNMIIAHLQAYELIHKIRKDKDHNDTNVGFAMHYTYLQAEKGSRRASFSVWAMNHVFHTIFEKGFVLGQSVFPLRFKHTTKAEKKLDRYCDFIGVNYYTRHMVYPSNKLSMMFGEARADKNATDDLLNDMGWEIYPEGLRHVLLGIKSRHSDLPIYITENGIPDDTDDKRANYIYQHLKVVSEVVEQGVNVQRFYYWSTMDNLEWDFGFWPRFGLIEVDFETFERTIRKSGHFYGEICAEKAVTKEMIEKYLG